MKLKIKISGPLEAVKEELADVIAAFLEGKGEHCIITETPLLPNGEALPQYFLGAEDSCAVSIERSNPDDLTSPGLRQYARNQIEAWRAAQPTTNGQTP